MPVNMFPPIERQFLNSSVFLESIACLCACGYVSINTERVLFSREIIALFYSQHCYSKTALETR